MAGHAHDDPVCDTLGLRGDLLGRTGAGAGRQSGSRQGGGRCRAGKRRGSFHPRKRAIRAACGRTAQGAWELTMANVTLRDGELAAMEARYRTARERERWIRRALPAAGIAGFIGFWAALVYVLK